MAQEDELQPEDSDYENNGDGLQPLTPCLPPPLPSQTQPPRPLGTDYVRRPQSAGKKAGEKTQTNKQTHSPLRVANATRLTFDWGRTHFITLYQGFSKCGPRIPGISIRGSAAVKLDGM